MNAQPEMCLQAAAIAAISEMFGTPRSSGGTFSWPVSPRGWTAIVEIRLDCVPQPQECLVRVCAPERPHGDGEVYAILRSGEDIENLLSRLSNLFPPS